MNSPNLTNRIRYWRQQQQQQRPLLEYRGVAWHPVFRRISFSWRHIWGYRMFVYIIDHIYFTNNGSTKIMSMSFCTVFIQVIRGRPGGLFQYTEGEKVKICFASTLSSIQAICPNRVKRRAWIISVSRGWLVWHRTSSLEMKWYHLMLRNIRRHQGRIQGWWTGGEVEAPQAPRGCGLGRGCPPPQRGGVCWCEEGAMPPPQKFFLNFYPKMAHFCAICNLQQ